MNPTADQPERPAVPLVSQEKSELPLVGDDQWLDAKQLGAEFVASKDCVRAWRKAGYIPKRFIRAKGRRMYHPALVAYLDEFFASSHRKRTVGSAA